MTKLTCPPAGVFYKELARAAGKREPARTDEILVLLENAETSVILALNSTQNGRALLYTSLIAPTDNPVTLQALILLKTKFTQKNWHEFLSPSFDGHCLFTHLLRHKDEPTIFHLLSNVIEKNNMKQINALYQQSKVEALEETRFKKVYPSLI